jgi:hypothetical protein
MLTFREMLEHCALAHLRRKVHHQRELLRLRRVTVDVIQRQ